MSLLSVNLFPSKSVTWKTADQNEYKLNSKESIKKFHYKYSLYQNVQWIELSSPSMNQRPSQET